MTGAAVVPVQRESPARKTRWLLMRTSPVMLLVEKPLTLLRMRTTPVSALLVSAAPRLNVEPPVMLPVMSSVPMVVRLMARNWAKLPATGESWTEPEIRER